MRSGEAARRCWYAQVWVVMTCTIFGCTSPPLRDHMIDFQGALGEAVPVTEGARHPITLDGDEITTDAFTVPLPLPADLGAPGTLLLFHNGVLQRMGRIPLETDDIGAVHYTAGWRVSSDQLALALGPGATVDREVDAADVMEITVHVPAMRWRLIRPVHARIIETAGANAPDTGEVLFISETIATSRIEFHVHASVSRRIMLRGNDMLAAHLLDAVRWDDAEKTILTREFHEPVPIFYKTVCLDNAKGCPCSETAGLLRSRE